jgi:hypothetical protein
MSKSPIQMSPAINHYYSSGSQISNMRHSSRAQVTEMQPGSYPLRVTGTYYLCEVMLSQVPNVFPLPVVRADNLPSLKTLLWRKGKFYVTVSYGATTMRTRSVQRMENHVEWDEILDAL